MRLSNVSDGGRMPKFVVVLDDVQTPVAAQRFAQVVEAEDAKGASAAAFENLDQCLPLISETYTVALVEPIV